MKKQEKTIKLYIRGGERYVWDLYFTKSSNIFANNNLVEIPISLVDEYREASEKFEEMQDKILNYYDKSNKE